MIVVPVAGDNQLHGVSWVYADPFEVFEGLRISVPIDARIDNYPGSLANVHHHTLAVPRAEQGDFDFVVIWRSVLA